MVKSETHAIFRSNSLIWRGKWIARNRRLALRSLSPGNIIVLPFEQNMLCPRQWKKYAATFGAGYAKDFENAVEDDLFTTHVLYHGIRA